jgi:hypothetical protein
MGLDIYIERVKRSQIGYFRKVNFLVRFFAKKGFDVDNQTPFRINQSMAKELLDACNEVLKDHSKAKELLPTMSGFFFGSTEYDDYYFQNIEKVRDWVNNTLIPEFDKLGEDEFIEFSTWY